MNWAWRPATGARRRALNVTDDRRTVRAPGDPTPWRAGRSCSGSFTPAVCRRSRSKHDGRSRFRAGVRAAGRARRGRPPSRSRRRRCGRRTRCRVDRSGRAQRAACGPLRGWRAVPARWRPTSRSAPSRARSMKSAVSRSSSPVVSGRSAKQPVITYVGAPRPAACTARAVADAQARLAAHSRLAPTCADHALRARRRALHERPPAQVGAADHRPASWGSRTPPGRRPWFSPIASTPGRAAANCNASSTPADEIDRLRPGAERVRRRGEGTDRRRRRPPAR